MDNKNVVSDTRQGNNMTGWESVAAMADNSAEKDLRSTRGVRELIHDDLSALDSDNRFSLQGVDHEIGKYLDIDDGNEENKEQAHNLWLCHTSLSEYSRRLSYQSYKTGYTIDADREVVRAFSRLLGGIGLRGRFEHTQFSNKEKEFDAEYVNDNGSKEIRLMYNEDLFNQEMDADARDNRIEEIREVSRYEHYYIIAREAWKAHQDEASSHYEKSSDGYKQFEAVAFGAFALRDALEFEERVTAAKISKAHQSDLPGLREQLASTETALRGVKDSVNNELDSFSGD